MAATLRVRLAAGVADAIRELVVGDQRRRNEICRRMFDFLNGLTLVMSPMPVPGVCNSRERGGHRRTWLAQRIARRGRGGMAASVPLGRPEQLSKSGPERPVTAPGQVSTERAPDLRARRAPYRRRGERRVERGCHSFGVPLEGFAYDEIGRSYSKTRREDPRIAAQILDALGEAGKVLNVGAGTGNYEPSGRHVVAVEPSAEMIGQRRDRTRRVLRGTAEALPFGDRTFDASMAILTIHHWTNVMVGLKELRRVSARQVVFFFEPLRTHDFWALNYFPEAASIQSERNAPGVDVIGRVLRICEIRTVLVPRDCLDGFGAAFWARPEAYLDPEVQAGMSSFALMSAEARMRGSDKLAADLPRANGTGATVIFVISTISTAATASPSPSEAASQTAGSLSALGSVWPAGAVICRLGCHAQERDARWRLEPMPGSLGDDD